MAEDLELQIKLSASDAAGAAFKSAAGEAKHLSESLKATGEAGEHASAGAEHAGEGAEKGGEGAEEAEGKFGKLKEALSETGKIAAGMIAGNVLQSVTNGIDEQFADAVGSATKFGTAVYDLQTRIGGTAQEASDLVAAMQEMKIDVGAGTQAIDIFAKGIDTAGTSAKTAAGGTATVNATLAQLGINAKNADGSTRPMNDILGEVADKFKEMPDGAQKTAIAMTLFGRSGAQMIPMLDLGKEGLADISAEAQKYGLQLTGQNVAAIRQFTLAHNQMDMAIEGARLQIGTMMIPILNVLISGLTAVIAAAVPFVENFIRAAQVGQTLGAVWQAMQPYLTALGAQLEAFGAKALPAVESAMEGLKPTGDAISELFQALKDVAGELIDVVQALVAPFLGVNSQMDAGQTAGTEFASVLQDVVDAVNAVSAVILAATKFIADHKAVQQLLVIVLGAEAVAWGLNTAAALAHTVAVTAGTLATNAMTVAQTALNVVLDANPIGLVVIALAALTAGLVYAYQNSTTFRNIVQGAMSDVGAAFNALGSIANTVFGGIEAIIGKVSSAAQALAGFLGGIHAPSITLPSIPGRAIGGPVGAGSPYIVGENGPELFVPNGSGSIVPNGALTGMGGGRPVVVNVTVTGNTMLANDSQTARQLATILSPELNRLVKLHA